jgi:hypothetical protein
MDSAAKRTPAVIALALVAAALASCIGDRVPPDALTRSASPPVNMAGRWILQSPGQGQCYMTFGVAAGVAEGTIAPEGGCPGQFYTSRKWTFDSTGLTIRNHNGEPLAQLTVAGTQFAGQATSGEAITLTR